MRKLSVALFVLAIMASVMSGVCFAGEGDSGDIVCDNEYSGLGFKAHSWITESGGQTIAHTQIIDLATGQVIKQIDKQCNSEISNQLENSGS